MLKDVQLEMQQIFIDLIATLLSVTMTVFTLIRATCFFNTVQTP